MATVTSIQSLPIPQSTDTPDVPRDFALLANALEKQLVMKFTDAAARDAKITVPTAGMLCILTSTSTIHFHNGTAWTQFYPATGSVTSVGTSVPANSSGANGDIFFKI